MTSRAVSDRADPFEIERRLEIRQQIDTRRDIVEGLRPPAAVSDSPVLEIPRCAAAAGQVLAEPVHQRAVVTRLPVAAVDDDDDRMQPLPVGKKQLSELAGVIPVPVQRACDGASVAPSEHVDD